MAKDREPPALKPATEADFRKAIDKAAEDGVARQDMVLHLTLRDEAHLKMNRSQLIRIAFTIRKLSLISCWRLCLVPSLRRGFKNKKLVSRNSCFYICLILFK